jgi:hypothetical protein
MIYFINLGGTAEAEAFVPWRDKGFFVFAALFLYPEKGVFIPSDESAKT